VGVWNQDIKDRESSSVSREKRLILVIVIHFGEFLHSSEKQKINRL